MFSTGDRAHGEPEKREGAITQQGLGKRGRDVRNPSGWIRFRLGHEMTFLSPLYKQSEAGK